MLRRLVAEPIVLSIITLNLVVLFLRAYPSQRGVHDWLFFLDLACLGYFVFELSVKVSLDGWRAFWARNMNRFDFMVVAVSAPTFAMAFTDASDLSFILVLRGARVLRLFRVLRFMPDAERIWGGIGRAMKASVGIILAFFLYNVLLGIFAGHMFGELDAQHFGTPMRAIYTVFKAFTVEGWYEVPEAVAVNATPGMAIFVRLFFVGAVVSGGLLGLAIVNAVFVDEMVADNQDELEAQLAALASQVEQVSSENAQILERLDRLLTEAPSEEAGPEP